MRITTALALAALMLAYSLVPAADNEHSIPVGETAAVNEWVGKSYDDLVSAYGKPSRIRKEDDGHRAVLYKVKITGDLVEVNTALEVGVGDHAFIAVDGNISPASPPTSSFIDAPNEPHAIVLGKQKLTFFLNADDVIEKVEVAPVKWKKRAMERSLQQKEPPEEEEAEEES